MDSGLAVIELVLLILAAVCVTGLTVVCWALIFRKAGEDWWKILVPFYGTYTQFKITGSTGMFWGMTACTAGYGILSVFIRFLLLTISGYDAMTNLLRIANLLEILYIVVMVLVHIFFSIDLARAFRRDGEFACGLILMPPVFLAFLAFGREKKGGGYLSPDSEPEMPQMWKCPQCGGENPLERCSCLDCGHVR